MIKATQLQPYRLFNQQARFFKSNNFKSIANLKFKARYVRRVPRLECSNKMIEDLTKELNSYKIENYSKKSYYQKNKEKIIEKIKEYNKQNVKDPEKVKEYNKKAYEKRKAKKQMENNKIN